MLKMENSMVLSSGAHQKGEMVEEKRRHRLNDHIKDNWDEEVENI
ncbi:hypothetical protein [Staphylococcus delphini]|nr:hypothetical protein [Staphylococcus delphini]MDE9751611.1 hypothetical protein [Staphylococcus delphini]MDE9788889.1 hypothetical protein [Staphylococcus delphini]MDE9791477.1 hypothetical protein [Staphylococcus delphini]MDE9793808.1 hypothetical protein [Staphylococcus delphini]MDE9797929.1 hypothetical protein [Staphylococcus delphini]